MRGVIGKLKAVVASSALSEPEAAKALGAGRYSSSQGLRPGLKGCRPGGLCRALALRIANFSQPLRDEGR